MLFLLFSILSGVSIYLLFKYTGQKQVHLGSVITINYLVAFVLGVLFSGEGSQIFQVWQYNWFAMALLIAFLFVVMFFVIGYATNKVGVAITSAATRLSMVIPILVSIFLFDESKTLMKFVEIALALVAVYLALYRKPDRTIPVSLVILPFILFVGSGSIDTMVKVAQHLFVPEEQTNTFAMSLFLISFLISLPFLLYNSKKSGVTKPNKHTLLAGVLLGLANYGSLFFIMMALNTSNFESSVVFGINNMAIVCVSSLIGIYFYREQFSTRNRVGLALAVFALLLLIF